MVKQGRKYEIREANEKILENLSGRLMAIKTASHGAFVPALHQHNIVLLLTVLIFHLKINRLADKVAQLRQTL